MKQFQAESKRLLDLMINSIYTHNEIFLRELISNSSDAIDKVYYKALTDTNIVFNSSDYYIKITPDKVNRTLTISDSGIGMTKDELDSNLGTIAKSGSLSFKEDISIDEEHSIIGQFGVGFYSAFMIADKIIVTSKSANNGSSYMWSSEGIDGYTISPADKTIAGTDITLFLKKNTEEQDYDKFLEEHTLKDIIKKYSDFIRYPIKMNVTKSKLKEDSGDDYEQYIEEETINSMVPLWKKNKNELTNEDYESFYREQHYGYDKPLKYIHTNAEGIISYNALLYIPENVPFDFYSSDYKKGLELYSSGVMIMENCSDLLPDYFSFVRGLVDSEDLSLNISREMLQHNRQLLLIAKNIKNKIKSDLETMLKNERFKYELFFDSFGRQLKYGVYDNFGANKDDLKDLLLFYSSKDKKLITLNEYIEHMIDSQKQIYYATGESIERISKLPQAETLLDDGYEILYLIDKLDEFVIKTLDSYNDIPFMSISSSDVNMNSDSSDDNTEEYNDMFKKMKEILSDRVSDVIISKRLKNHPVCLSNRGDLSVEMEKTLNAIPNNDQLVRAEKVLEINSSHDMFNSLELAFSNDSDKFRLYTELLYSQALLIEGLPIEDPVEFANNINKLW